MRERLAEQLACRTAPDNAAALGIGRIREKVVEYRLVLQEKSGQIAHDKTPVLGNGACKMPAYLRLKNFLVQIVQCHQGVVKGVGAVLPVPERNDVGIDHWNKEALHEELYALLPGLLAQRVGYSGCRTGRLYGCKVARGQEIALCVTQGNKMRGRSGPGEEPQEADTSGRSCAFSPAKGIFFAEGTVVQAVFLGLGLQDGIDNFLSTPHVIPPLQDLCLLSSVPRLQSCQSILWQAPHRREWCRP